MAKIKRDDEVVVIAGKDKGKRGKVLNVAEGRVLVAGVNLVKKHVKPNPNRGEQGGILEREAALNISNIALFNQATNKADRVGYKILEDGKKVRIFKSTGEVADTK
ncbi:50S ribosomal protein L24 [Paraperlucidibaca wandonensis]|jgi:large subunit ribosomal protein L24|uniref:Large ribosomal subunit protein uL24 n=1 Tax=Paraperlucidibaca wandonensis TaxID=1268273 RepID=A0ABW3HJN8_9GAMM|nr:50S ribosomal protein L24 [Paraperlucidibaca sp.]MBQ0723740.1 50S ribosomal protein L24 [Paraperlucidibaca sp.]MBQ0843193.1 50S ribosomal protein L24 [Paraperlucidibaca sp.]|tara:strand:+ start:5761 stop:6078 length:318 start_codon:yes stop_codon:yes gene_type:complete